MINQVDTYLYGSYPMGTSGLNTYFQSVYHEEDTLTLASDGEMTNYMSFLRIIKETINLNNKVYNICVLKLSATKIVGQITFVCL